MFLLLCFHFLPVVQNIFEENTSVLSDLGECQLSAFQYNFTRCSREHPSSSAAFCVVTLVATGTNETGFPSPIALMISPISFKALKGTTILSFVSSISIYINKERKKSLFSNQWRHWKGFFFFGACHWSKRMEWKKDEGSSDDPYFYTLMSFKKYLESRFHSLKATGAISVLR